MAVHIVIPARYASTRLPGKPLLLINNKPIIWHVYQRAIETGIASIIVATDHAEIFDVVKDFGGNVLMTSSDHVNGTDRLSEVAEKLSFNQNDIVINLQGDEPLIPAKLIDILIELLERNPTDGMATLCSKISDTSSVFNPNVVKLTKMDSGRALYFSRAPIPWNRDSFNNPETAMLATPYFRHIGMYAYRVQVLKDIALLNESSLENCESLEQLRVLQAGITIQVGEIEQAPPHGVDTMDDYLNIKKLIEN